MADSKKTSIIRVLQVLQEFTDSRHPLTQEEIIEKLQKQYDLTLERKAVANNISYLQEVGFEICQAEGRRGVYLDHSGSDFFGCGFEDAEIQYLIDLVICNKIITRKQSKDLVEKLSGLSSKYLNVRVPSVYRAEQRVKTDYATLFGNIELIEEAIKKKVKLTCDYKKYGIDKKMHESSKHVLSPYALLVQNRNYYVMGYSDIHSSMTFLRVDHMANIEIKPRTQAVDIKTVEGYENGINEAELSTCYPYMYSGKPEIVRFVCQKNLIDQVIDWFGTTPSFQQNGDDEVIVTLRVNKEAMRYWALQYVNGVEILEPESLRNQIRDDLNKAADKYKK